MPYETDYSPAIIVHQFVGELWVGDEKLKDYIAREKPERTEAEIDESIEKFKVRIKNKMCFTVDAYL